VGSGREAGGDGPAVCKIIDEANRLNPKELPVASMVSSSQRET